MSCRTVEVLRYEQQRDGKGPYPSIYWGDLPNPVDEGLSFEKGIHFCGCLTWEQLHVWWPPERMKPVFECSNGGVRLLSYHVPRDKVQVGKDQAIFDKRDTVYVEILAEGLE